MKRSFFLVSIIFANALAAMNPGNPVASDAPLQLVAPTPPVMETPLTAAEIENQLKEQAPLAAIPPVSVPENITPVPLTQTADSARLPASLTSETEKPAQSLQIAIGLNAQTLHTVVSTLNALLAQEYALYTKTLKFHWAVKGLEFAQFHALFKKQYKQIFKIVDLLAERAQALDEEGNAQLADENPTLASLAVNASSMPLRQMLKVLLNDQETITRSLRTAIETITALGDTGTSNLLQEILVQHEKMAWMIRSSLKNE